MIAFVPCRALLHPRDRSSDSLLSSRRLHDPVRLDTTHLFPLDIKLGWSVLSASAGAKVALDTSGTGAFRIREQGATALRKESGSWVL